MAYETEGYSGGGIGPLLIPKRVVADMSQVDTLKDQLAMTSDAKRKEQLLKLIALEQQKAQEMAAAQQVVQSAAQTNWSPVIPDYSARAQRDSMLEAIKRKYALASGKPGTGAVWGGF